MIIFIYGFKYYPVLINMEMSIFAFAGDLASFRTRVMCLYITSKLFNKLISNISSKKLTTSYNNIGFYIKFFKISKESQIRRITAQHRGLEFIKSVYYIFFRPIYIHRNLCFFTRHFKLKVSAHSACQIKTVVSKYSCSFLSMLHK